MTSRTYRALLIANSTFPDDRSNLPDLEGPRNDPAVLRDALCDRHVGLFSADNVRLVTERTMAEVLGEIEDFLRSASRQDTLLLYYSGHGMLDLGGELFLCTRDSRSDRLRSTSVKSSDLRSMMDESAAAATVVVLDCCHSGRFKGGGIPAALSGRGRFVLTSSRGAELAHDTHVRNHASLFTHHLAEGLLHGAEDHDGDGAVTLSELYSYVHGVLAGEGRQVPQKRFEGDGDVAMALRPSDSAPSGYRAELVDPASAAPIVDVSETSVDLGEIGADEALPPERIAVVNRGGGVLEWTVESSAAWVEAVAAEGAVILHLRPEPGPNRANVYVRDTLTGTIKTVRVSVRVRQAEPDPDRRPPPTPTPTPTPAPTPPPPRPWSWPPQTPPRPRSSPSVVAGQRLKRQWRAIVASRWAVVSGLVLAALAVVYLIIAVAYLVFAEVQEGTVVDRLEREAQRVDGEVTNISSSSYDVAFGDGDQRRSETLMEGTTTREGLEVGDEVTVLVDPERPEHVAVGGDTNYGGTLRLVLYNGMVGVIAVTVLIVALGVVYWVGLLIWARATPTVR